VRITEAAPPGGLEYPRGFRQALIVLLPPHHNEKEQRRRGNYTSWFLDDQVWVSSPWV